MRTRTVLSLLSLTAMFACKNGIDDETDAELADADGDSWTIADGDCDDLDDSVHPEADEVCDEIDNDCDGKVDEDAVDGTTWYMDADTDGWGDADESLVSCVDMPGYSEQPGDCVDANPQANPDMEELCNGFDDDCDGDVDEEDAAPGTWYADVDGDGYGDPDESMVTCEPPSGWVDNGDDCDDTLASVYPGADEYCNGIDDDCDGTIDEDDALDTSTWYADADADGYGDAATTTVACEPPEGWVANGDDCDETLADVHPGADEYCNEIDDDCDGTVDEGDALDATTWYADTDSDGHGDAATSMLSCDQPKGYVDSDDDCDDDEASAYPGGTEVCDEVDNDCDGTVDEDDATDVLTWYADADSDGYGDASTTDVDCDQPRGYVADDTDCDDTDADVNPGEDEYCNGIDDDCDGTIDESDAVDAETWYVDDDGDGYGDSSAGSVDSCSGVYGYAGDDGDCDDTDADINPDAEEVCDGVDNDCDGTADGSDATDISTWYLDSDADGYGDAASDRDSCTRPSGYVSSDEDCDDTDDTIYPGADETCNGEDDDCNGVIDDDATDAVELAVDADGDGFGAEGTTDYRCNGVVNELDCDDTDATEPQFVDALSGTTSPAGTFADPWLTIQDGIDASSTCVVVAPATYYENIDFGGSGITVLGATGAESTIIDGGANGPVVTFDSGEAADSILTGFTLTNGSGYESVTTTSYSCGSGSTCVDTYTSWCGGGIYIDGSSPTLTDLVVQDNDLTTLVDYVVGDDNYFHFSYGGGVCVLGATVEMEQVDLRYNYAEDGGAAYVDSTGDLSFEQGYVVGNTAESGGGFEVDGGDLTLINVASAFNEATITGGGVYAVDASLAMVNCTVGEDDSPTGGGIYLSGTTSGIVRNTIVYGANTGEGVLVDSTATFSGTYNDVYGNYAGEYSGTTDPTGSNGNLSTDPSFVAVSDDGDLTNDDFHLSTGSHCIDAGNPSSAFDDADGTTNDMGAWGGPSSDW